jgi:hypothetical protein
MVEVELFYGGLKFSGWYGRDGSLISRDQRRRMTVEKNATLRVAYKAAIKHKH